MTMRKSKTLSRLRANEPVRMCCLGHFIPAFIQHAAEFGYDCIWLDLEHRLYSEREVQSLLAYSHLADIDIMLRAPTLEKTGLYRYLEDGATGLMIPHVSTPEKAQMLADSVKFPPLGDRGLDAAGLDSKFYLSDPDAYVEHANRETFLVVQIETPEAVNNVNEIAAIPGVDGMFVGPGDLSLRLKHDTSMTLDGAIELVAAAAAQHNKAWGIPAGTIEKVKQYRDQGAQLINYGGEFGAIMDMLKSHGGQLAEVYG